MKALLLLLLFAAGCSFPCRTSRECQQGEHCNLQSGECVAACKANDDCSPGRTCNLESGKCSVILIGTLFDGGVGDTGTHTTTTSTGS